MSEIIDVDYKEIKEQELEEKTIEQLATEANTLWMQMEAIGNVGMMMAAQAGRCLQVIKDKLPHGKWEEWAKNNLSFSARKANRMMALAEKTADENSIFSNPTILSGIGISKVWALLSAPEDVAEEVVKNPEAPEMSVKEFQEEVRRLKEEKQGLNTEIEAIAEEREQIREDLEAEIDRLKAELNCGPQADSAELEAKEAELQKLQDKLAKEKEKSKKLKDSMDAEKKKAAADAKAEAEKAARKKFDEETKLLQDSNREAAEEIDRLQRALKNNSNESLLEFKLKSNRLQMDFGACLQSVMRMEQEDAAQAGKMRSALKLIMEQMMKEL